MIEYVLEKEDVERVHGRGDTAVHALRRSREARHRLPLVRRAT